MEAAVWASDRLEAGVLPDGRPLDGWGTDEELLATLIEVLDLTRRDVIEATVLSNGGKLRRKLEPIRLEHPGRRRMRGQNGAPKKTDWAAVARFFGMSYDPHRGAETDG